MSHISNYVETPPPSPATIGRSPRALRRVRLEGIAVSAPERNEPLGGRRGLEQPAAVGEGDHLVGPRMEEQLGEREPADPLDRRVLVGGEPANRGVGNQLLGPLDDGGERAVEHQARRRGPAHQLDRHGRSQRMAEDDDPLLRNAQRVAQVAVGGVGVPVEPLLGGHALALAVAAIVEREEAQPERAKPGIVVRAAFGLRKFPAFPWQMSSQYPGPLSAGMTQLTSRTPSDAVSSTRLTSRPSSAGGGSSVRLPPGTYSIRDSLSRRRTRKRM